MGGRSRLWFYAETVAGQGQSINLLETVPFNATLLQVTTRVSPISSADEPLLVNKVSGQGPQYSCRLVTRNPYEEQTNYLACRGPWEFRKGDSISVTYPNTADGQVGVEVCFTEGE